MIVLLAYHASFRMDVNPPNANKHRVKQVLAMIDDTLGDYRSGFARIREEEPGFSQ